MKWGPLWAKLGNSTQSSLFVAIRQERDNFFIRAKGPITTVGGRASEREEEDHKSAHLSLLTMTTVAHSRELEQRLLRIYDHGDRALNLAYISAIWVDDNNSQIGLLSCSR